MKRFLKIALLLGLLTLLLCVAAYATDGPTTSGVYALSKNNNVNGLTVTVYDVNSDAIAEADATIDSAQVKFYSGAVKFGVNITGLAPDGFQLVFALDGEGAPTADNLHYIDQSSGSSVSFMVYPDKLENGKTYHVYLIGTGATTKTELFSFKYYQPYKLGDVDGENGLDAYDASLILQYLVGLYDFVGTGELAADVDGENGVDAYDASLILQHLVGLYTIPGWEEA